MPLQPQTVVDDHSAKCQLFIAALRSYGRASLRVNGTSMWPALWPGDTVEVRLAGIHEIKAGELVAFAREDRIFVHRVVQKLVTNGCAALITRGDALSSDDPPVGDSELLGVARVTEKVPRTLVHRLRQTFHYRWLPPVMERLRS